jgi:hypothetical protein
MFKYVNKNLLADSWVAQIINNELGLKEYDNTNSIDFVCKNSKETIIKQVSLESLRQFSLV